jgi:hypothetical protein
MTGCMKKAEIKIGNIPALLYGANSKKLYIFVHGRCSNKEEAENFSIIATENGYQVISFDLPEHLEYLKNWTKKGVGK